MKKAISQFLKYGTLISTYGLILSVLVQIYARFFLSNAPAWTEEASRLFFIYAIAFSAGLALESKEYVHLDLFFDKLSKRMQKGLLIIIAATTLTLFAIMAIYAVQFVSLGHAEYSPGMKIRMSYVFFSMVIMAGFLSYFACIALLKALKNIK